eukprot:3371934-Amphidinium_carterae.1
MPREDDLRERTTPPTRMGSKAQTTDASRPFLDRPKPALIVIAYTNTGHASSRWGFASCVEPFAWKDCWHAMAPRAHVSPSGKWNQHKTHEFQQPHTCKPCIGSKSDCMTHGQRTEFTIEPNTPPATKALTPKNIKT